MSGKNIVILNHHATAPDTGGGGRHFELAKYLSENGHRVTVIASSFSNGKKEYLIQDRINVQKFNRNFTFVRIKTVPRYNGIAGRFLNYIDYMFKASRWNNYEFVPDTIIASSVHPLAWTAGYKLSVRYDASFIVEVRDLWPLSMYEDFSGIMRKVVFKYFEGLENKYYNLADAIITTAPFAYEYMETRFNLKKGKVFHIPHGINIEKFDRDASQGYHILDKYLAELLDKFFCVTYTGSLSKSEGLETLVEAGRLLQGIPKIKILIIGSGDQRSLLEEKIRQERLNNVIILGGQPRSFVPLILKNSKILFCGLIDRKAFRYGISKNKFYDYMASAKPIIFASNVRGSLITQANAGITIPPHDPEKLAKEIRELYLNADKAAQFGLNGRKFVELYHSIEKIAKDFLKVIYYAREKRLGR